MDHKKIKVLIVDDEKPIITTYKMYFEDFSATFAENGQEALDLLKTKDFDVLITDLNMPLMNGIELIRNQKKIRPSMKSILVSGQLEKDLCVELANMGVRLVDKLTPIDKVIEFTLELYNDIKVQQETLRNAMIGKGSNQLFHDMANNLSVISVSSEIGLIQYDKPELVQKQLKKSIQSVENLKRTSELYKQKIYGSKEIKVSQIFLKPYFTDMVEDLALICQDHKFEFRSVIDVDSKDYVVIEPDLFKQVIVNLITNSIHAEQNSTQSKWVELIVEKDFSGRLEIVVKDSGSGIPTEFVKNLFKEGFTTKGDKGTGMGLSYCKSQIEAFFGKIDYDPVDSHTAFKIRMELSNTNDESEEVA